MLVYLLLTVVLVSILRNTPDVNRRAATMQNTARAVPGPVTAVTVVCRKNRGSRVERADVSKAVWLLDSVLKIGCWHAGLVPQPAALAIAAGLAPQLGAKHWLTPAFNCCSHAAFHVKLGQLACRLGAADRPRLSWHRRPVRRSLACFASESADLCWLRSFPGLCTACTICVPLSSRSSN